MSFEGTMKLVRWRGGTPSWCIRTNDFIDEKVSDFEGLMDMQGRHSSVWCDRFMKRGNFS